MGDSQDSRVVQYRKKLLIKLAAYLVVALFGAAVLAWWFSSPHSGLFDFYKAYVIGMGIALLVFGIGSAVKALMMMSNREKLAAAAAEIPDEDAARRSQRAMATAFQVYLGVMVVALVFIGQIFNYTSFVVCLFSVVFAILCYLFVGAWQRKGTKKKKA